MEFYFDSTYTVKNICKLKKVLLLFVGSFLTSVNFPTLFEVKLPTDF
jgi:hypothetical protein